MIAHWQKKEDIWTHSLNLWKGSYVTVAQFTKKKKVLKVITKTTVGEKLFG